MSPEPDAKTHQPKLFLPSRRGTFMLAIIAAAALSAALFLRYAIIQNSAIGVVCEAGEDSLTCKLRLAVILMFVRGLFGWVALGAACVQLLRPNMVVFGTGVAFALLGLVLYNTRISALAAALLVLSLARPAPGAR
jgi:hypothetical protein